MSYYLQDTEIELDEYTFKTVPGLVIYNAFLSIAVDRTNDIDGEWYIDSLYAKGFGEEEGITYRKGDWLFDTLSKEINNDHRWEDKITRQCADLD